jgi:hypothetical protein
LIEEYVLRFFIGGIAVSAFAALGDIFRPRSFAGLFGAAPSIAIATLMITLWKQGPHDTAIEGRSMLLGAVALGVYSVIVFRLLKRHHLGTLFSSLSAILGWLAVALGLDWLMFG